MAEVILRVGLNLHPGQPLLVTDPYDLQGAHPETASLVEAVHTAVAALEPGRPRPGLEFIPANPSHLRALVESDDLPRYETLVATHARRLQRHLAQGGAFLFLTGTVPQLLSGLPADRLQRFDTVKWRHLGPLIQRLTRGATQWTLAPAPTSDWATAAGVSVAALWETTFAALRIGASPTHDNLPSHAVTSWRAHLASLARHRDSLNAARHRRMRYRGPDTDLTLALPRFHTWCTAQLTTKAGVSFVANLPTEEIFTAPHRHSAQGTLRVARPVAHAGAVIEDIRLEFRHGRVVHARARSGETLLHQLLATDPGASRLGEVALVPGNDLLPWASQSHHHTLLDENAAPHVALGESYRFCSRAWLPLVLNRSQLHLDLPLEAKIELA